MTNNSELVYNTSPPPSNRYRIIIRDGSTKKVEFIGNIDPIIDSEFEISATLHDVIFEPDLGFDFFLFHVVRDITRKLY